MTLNRDGPYNTAIKYPHLYKKYNMDWLHMKYANEWIHSGWVHRVRLGLVHKERWVIEDRDIGLSKNDLGNVHGVDYFTRTHEVYDEIKVRENNFLDLRPSIILFTMSVTKTSKRKKVPT